MVNGVYFIEFNEIEKEIIIKYIKRKNMVLYLKLKIINYKFLLIIKKPNSLGKIKRALIIILNIVLTEIYNGILDKRIIKGGFIK